MTKLEKQAFLVGLIVFGLMVFGFSQIDYTSKAPRQLVIAEDGSYGVSLNMKTYERCMVPILASYQWAEDMAQVNGLEVCHD